MQLYKASLVHAFGRGSPRPARAAAWRLAGLSIAALALGTLFAWAAGSLSLVPAEHPERLLIGCLLAVQLLIVVTLLGGSQATRDPQDTFSRWLQTLPISAERHTALLLLPQMVLAALALLLAVTPLAVVLLAFGMPLTLIAVGISLGTLCAFGLVYGLPFRAPLRLLFIAIILGAEYKLAGMISLHGPVFVPAVVCYLTIIVGLIGAAAHGIKHYGRFPPAHKRTVIRTAWLPAGLWFIKKLIRRPAAMLSLAVSLSLATGLAWYVQRQGMVDPNSIGLAAALLAGSFVADMRALARRNQPAEIAGLYGTNRFLLEHISSAVVCGALVVLPLLWSLGSDVSVVYITQVFLGISAGLLAGTLVVPEARDVMSQLLSVLCLLALLAALPHAPFMAGLSPGLTAIVHACEAIMLLAIAGITERRRNNYIWRTT